MQTKKMKLHSPLSTLRSPLLKAGSMCLTLVLMTINQSSQANNLVPGAKQVKPIAILHGKVFTVSHGIIENGTVIFDNGKITGVGTNLPIPADAEIIDATGKFVYPGLIAPNTSLGLVEIDAVRSTRDASEVGAINPSARGDMAYNPDSEIPPTVRTNGVTSAEIAPSGGILSGTSAMMNLDGWTREDMTVKQPLAVHCNWPSMEIHHGWWVKESDDDQKKNIEKSLSVLTDAIRDARSYYLAKKNGNGNVPTDVRWEAMIPVFDRAIPLIVHAGELKQIQAAIALCEKENIRMVLADGGDAWKVAPLLKQKNIPMILGRTNALPSREEEPYDLGLSMPKRIYDSGIQFCLSDAGSWPQRNLPFQAGTAIGYGLPADVALRAVTLSTAEILGVADRLGSLDAGKDANIVISTGDILDMATNNVVAEYIQGRKVDLNNKQRELYMKYEEKYARRKAGK